MRINKGGEGKEEIGKEVRQCIGGCVGIDGGLVEEGETFEKEMRAARKGKWVEPERKRRKGQSGKLKRRSRVPVPEA